MYENRQGKYVGSVSILLTGTRVWIEIDVTGMDRSYRIRNNNNFCKID